MRTFRLVLIATLLAAGPPAMAGDLAPGGTLRAVYLGTNPAYKDYPDITLRELLCIVPLVVLAVVLGVVPSAVLYWMEPHVTGLIDSLVMLTR